MRVALQRPSLGPLREFELKTQQALERRAMVVTKKATVKALSEIRSQMSSTKLGRLSRAIGQVNDADKGHVFRRGKYWSASGFIFAKSASERTLGAIEAYTEGATILPRNKSGFLWIATDEIPSRVGRKRMTPALYRSGGFEQRIGPLIKVKSINGNPLLIVRDASVKPGIARSARARTKTGRVRKGFQEKSFIVAFIGIPRTSRDMRVDLEQIVQNERNRLPQYWRETEGLV